MEGCKPFKAAALMGCRSRSATKVAENCYAEEKEATEVRVGMIWKDIQGASNWNGMLNPINPALRSELLKYGQMTQATYDAFDANPFSKYRGASKYSPPHFFPQAGLPNSGYDITTYLYATSSTLFRKIAQQTQWMGYVAVSNLEETKRIGRRDIVVAWRGTKTQLEWLEDFRDILQKPTNLQHSVASGVKIEKGFLEVYTSTNSAGGHGKISARDQLHAHFQILLRKYEDEELSLTFIGHSLGGALALLSAYDVLLNGLLGRPISATHVTVFSFGAPRVGNLAFHDTCSQLGLKVLRHVNVHDCVPKAPGILVNETLQIPSQLLRSWPWTYYHVGLSLVVDTTKSPFIKKHLRDPFIHHNLELYLHLLDGYHSPTMHFKSATARDPALVNKYADLLIDEMGIPPSWKQDLNKGLVQNTKGKWVMPQRPFAWL